MDTDYGNTDGNKMLKIPRMDLKSRWAIKKEENHNTQEKYSTNFKQKTKNADICVT